VNLTIQRINYRKYDSSVQVTSLPDIFRTRLKRCVNIDTCQHFLNAISLVAHTFLCPLSPFTPNLADKNYKERRRIILFEGHTHVSCFLEVTAFCDWMVKFYRDQADQSRVSHVSQMADWIAAYGKVLMPHESAK